MIDVPRRHRLFMLALVLAAVATAPFPFIGRETVLVLGLPLWLWWSMFFTAVFSGLTAWGILHLWRDNADD